MNDCIKILFFANINSKVFIDDRICSVGLCLGCRPGMIVMLNYEYLVYDAQKGWMFSYVIINNC